MCSQHTTIHCLLTATGTRNTSTPCDIIANDPGNLNGDEEMEEKEEHRRCREFHLTHYYRVPLHPLQLLQRPSIRTISAFFWRNVLLLSFILRYIFQKSAKSKDLFGSFFQIKSTIRLWIFKRFCDACLVPVSKVRLTIKTEIGEAQ